MSLQPSILLFLSPLLPWARWQGPHVRRILSSPSLLLLLSFYNFFFSFLFLSQLLPHPHLSSPYAAMTSVGGDLSLPLPVACSQGNRALYGKIVCFLALVNLLWVSLSSSFFKINFAELPAFASALCVSVQCPFFKKLKAVRLYLSLSLF